MGLDSDGLSQLVGVDTAGLLGVDILNRFDIIMDLPGVSIAFSKAPLMNTGCHVPLTDFMEIPICEVKLGESHLSAFFDTGAQISYFEATALERFPREGNVTDFYPGIGRFDVETYRAEIEIGRKPFHLRSAPLPSVLGFVTDMAAARGIVGNELMRDRVIGYFPRRRVFAL